jgi:hypothetical protein
MDNTALQVFVLMALLASIRGLAALIEYGYRRWRSRRGKSPS